MGAACYVLSVWPKPSLEPQKTLPTAICLAGRMGLPQAQKLPSGPTTWWSVVPAQRQPEPTSQVSTEGKQAGNWAGFWGQDVSLPALFYPVLAGLRLQTGVGDTTSGPPC